MTLPEDTMLENRYRIDRLLAHGGMGAIYRGFDTNLNVAVAIKENFFQTPQNIRQFQQEALILARLRHPGLPRVIHHFSFDGQQYLVMDFIEGEDLWQLVKRRGQPLPEAQAVDYLIQVCEAVLYLHRQDPPIIHRDIKPQNIKITPDGQAVLVDFGIAKVAEADSRTRTGAQAVTPGFSPPEQYSGLGTTPLSDVYSLGATLYAVLTATKPPDSISLMVKPDFTRPNLINTRLSEAVTQAVLHAMQPQVEARPPGVPAWQRQLKAVLQQVDQETRLPPGPEPDIDQTLVDGDSLPQSTPFWLVDGQGQGYVVGDEPLVIGRHSRADVTIEDASVSRHHALIRREGQQCLITDNASANGTFLNGRRLGSDWSPLESGDVIKLGHVRLDLSRQRPLPADGPSLAPNAGQDEVRTQPEPRAPQPAFEPAARSAPQAARPMTPPAAAAKRAMWPVFLASVLVLLLGGGAAFFAFNSSSAANAAATAQTGAMLGNTATAAAGQTQTAEANAALAGQTETAEARSAATQTAGQTATARAQPTTTATRPPATATSTRRPPAATATRRPASPTPTATPRPPTATPASQANTAAVRPSPAGGPTVIPVESDVSVQVIGKREVTDVDINAQNPLEVYALVKGDGIYKSAGGGEGPWTKLKVDGSAVTAFTISPHNSARLYASTWNAVLRSDDGGNSWKAFGNGLRANRVVDVVTVDPVDPNLLYAGIGSTLVVSGDGGENWVSDGYGRGLGGGRFTSIVVDPFNHDIVYAAGEFGSIYKSFDSGRTFKQMPYGVGRGVYGLTPHPARRDVYLAGINAYDAGIIKTENGADFSSVSNGLVFGGADSAYGPLVFAPGNSNIIYAGSGYEDDNNARGIFKSSDGGKSWNAINDGLHVNAATGRPHYVKSIAVHPRDANFVLAATGGGLFKSTTGGASWSLR